LSFYFGLVEFKGENVFTLYVDIEEGSLIAQLQMLREELASVVEVTVVDLVEVLAEAIEKHVK
jgi:hypothetical protein